MSSCFEKVIEGEVPADVFIARGHPNITARNKRTLEITKDLYVTKRGDCVVACCAEKGAGELDREVLKALAKRGVVIVALSVGDVWDYVVGETPLATPTSNWRIVARKSRYVESSTVAVSINKAAVDFDRGLVARLRESVPVRVIIGVCPTYI
ncbi:MAG: DUF371 domain-containing protein [Pyrobaculum sp.]